VYLFVDLQLRTWETTFNYKTALFAPVMYIAPGEIVREHYLKNCQPGKMSRFHAPKDFIESYKEKHNIIDDKLK
jgi:hypothetical protein